VASVINYTPPKIIKEFIKDYRSGELFYDWIIGPVGSGKTTGIFFKLCYMAGLQEPSADGTRRTRAVIVRNTMPQLKDTTLKSWSYWFREGQAGTWNATDKIFVLKFGDVECEVLFRPLDTEDDITRVLSLEVTFAIIDEFVEIPKKIIEALAARCGRYKLPDGTAVTNWGMWGSSNPSTEDNWWFDHLTASPTVIPYEDEPDADIRMLRSKQGDVNAVYFHQPGGLTDEAENIENLPGKRGYYENLVKGKSEAWIKQFIDAEWGFSISGKSVVPTFKPDIHLSTKPLILNPHLPLIIGMDPGIGGSALIFMQQDTEGRLNVLGELIQEGYGAERLITERLKPYLRARWPNLDPNKIVIAPDPAAANRGQSDEKTVVSKFRKHYYCFTETNNRLPLRLDAIEHFTTRLLEVGPALRVDAARCPILVRALKGGWRYEVDNKKDMIKGDKPEKNAYSHPGDAFGYGCRYFHRQSEREIRYGSAATGKKFSPPRSFGSGYHFR